jgi:predicted MFS family arabinose efflux permease
MEQNNKPPKQYTGTKGLSLAIVIGIAIGTVIGKLINNMNTGLMLGLVLGVAGWVLLFNRRPKAEDSEKSPENEADPPTDNDIK